MNGHSHTENTFDSLASSYDTSFIVRHFQRPIQLLTMGQLEIKK